MTVRLRFPQSVSLKGCAKCEKVSTVLRNAEDCPRELVGVRAPSCLQQDPLLPLSVDADTSQLSQERCGSANQPREEQQGYVKVKSLSLDIMLETWPNSVRRKIVDGFPCRVRKRATTAASQGSGLKALSWNQGRITRHGAWRKRKGGVRV